ncbi:MAG: rod shape-determining protein MreD [Formosimonas sp.]
MRIEQALLTVKTRVVVLSLMVAWALSFLTVRQTVWLDWMAFVLLFWTTYQPSRVTYGLAFGLGILLDVQQATILGQHALIYVWLVFAMRQVAARLQYSSILMHALAATGLMFAAQLLRAFVSWLVLGKSVDIAAMLWILSGTLAWLLLAHLIARAAQSRAVGSWLAH